MDLIFASLALAVWLLFCIVIDINWRCLLGIHQFVYVGERHGMTRTKDGKGVVGSKRKMYKCCNCCKDKPTKKTDYI